MTKPSLALAFRIAQIIEEYPEREIRAAVDLLREHGATSSLLGYLNKDASVRNTKAVEAQHRYSPDTPRKVSTSKAVQDLREEDPEKYRLLSSFDELVRDGKILGTFEDLRRFGAEISKDFHPKKSRKDSIGALLALLARLPLHKVEDLCKVAASYGSSSNSDEYQRLAEYLIKGRRPDDKEVDPNLRVSTKP